MKIIATAITTVALSLLATAYTQAVEHVNVAVETGSKPLSFEDESGHLSGYEVDVIKALDDVITDYEFDIEAVDASAAEVGLTTGRYAFIGGGLFKNAKREARFLFPDYPNGASIITLYIHDGRSDITSLADLPDKRISPVTPNGGIYNLLKKYNEEHKNKPSQQLNITTGEGVSIADRFKQLDEGIYDALIIPNNLGFPEIRDKLNLHVHPVNQPVQVTPTYFVLNKQQILLKNALDKGLKEISNNGTLSSLNKKWYGEDNLALISENLATKK